MRLGILACNCWRVVLVREPAFWKQQVLPRRRKPYTKIHVINSRGQRKTKAVNSSHVRWAYIVRPTVIVSTCLCNYYQIRKPNRMAVV